MSLRKSTRSDIKAVVRRAKKGKHYIGFYEARRVGRFAHDLLMEATRHIEGGDLNSAFDIVITVLEEMTICINKYDDSNADYGGNIDHAMMLLENIVEEAPEPDLQKEIVKVILSDIKKDKFRHWDWEHECVNTILPLLDKRKAQAFLTIFNSRPKEKYDKHSTKTHIIGLIEKASGKPDAMEYAYDNLHNSSVREYLINVLIADEQFDNARSLIEEVLEEYPRHPTWLGKLKDLEIAEGNIRAAVEVSVRLFGVPNVRNKFDHLDYVKANTAQQEYDSIIDKLLDRYKVDNRYMGGHPDAMQLCEREGRWETLLEMLKGSHLYTIDHYAKDLKDTYPDEIEQIYYDAVKTWGDGASNRKQYRSVARYLIKLHKMGNTEGALDIADYLLDKYKYKPAMQEEILKVRLKLEG